MSFKNIYVLLALSLILSASPICLIGSYHIHSTFSDGALPVDEIARQAKEAGLDFIIITDHGNPNRRSSSLWGERNGVFVIGGSEADLHAGHATVLFYRPRSYRLPPDPPSFLEEIKEEGGFAVIAHPFDSHVPWKGGIGDFKALEVFNYASALRSLPLSGKLLFLLRYPFSRALILQPDEKWLQLWDRALMAGRRVLAFFAADAHGHSGPLPFPSYRKVFSAVRIAICGTSSPEKIPDFIKAGNFLNLMGSAEDIEKVRFEAVSSKRVFPAGSAELPLPAKIRVDFPAGVRAVLVHNGKKRELRGSGELNAEKGYYRLELYRSGRLWVLTNPLIFGPRPERKKPSISLLSFRPLPSVKFHIEKDPASRASFDPETGLFSFHLAEATSSHPNRWCALALREKLKLNGWDGICLKVSSERKLRFWIQIEAEGRWFFNASTGRKLFIPFSRFYRWDGSKGKMPSTASALFLSFDASSLFTPAEARVRLEMLGFCRFSVR